MPTSKGNKKAVEYPTDPRDIEWDQFMSVLDDALYEIAEQRYAGQKEPIIPSNQTMKAVQEYLHRARDLKCAYPCCTRSCSQY